MFLPRPVAAISLLLLAISADPLAADDGVYMATGFKIGEVDQHSAIVWTRLTREEHRHADGTPFTASTDLREIVLADMEGSAEGAAGDVRVRYWPAGQADRPQATEWQPVDPARDFTRQIHLTGLAPHTRYDVTVEGRPQGGDEATWTAPGGFRTPPASDDPAEVKFAVVTCQEYPGRDDQEGGHRIYRTMLAQTPDFFVHTGDIEYYDRPLPRAQDMATARFKWNRIYAMPFQRAFHQQVSSYFMKDDHDTLRNDCWPGQHYGDLTWEQGLQVFREQVPMGERTYRTVRWGKDLQIWLVEGRDFRSPNKMADGPEKTIWGQEQKEWFFKTVEASDATFRLLISPTPLVGPDKAGKNDNHANEGFAYEGQQLRDFISQQKNMFVVCGDRHWQYVAVDPATGLREYGCGPSSNKHIEPESFRKLSRSQQNEMHRFLRNKGGFLTISVSRPAGEAEISFCHHGVNGVVYHRDVFDRAGAK